MSSNDEKKPLAKRGAATISKPGGKRGGFLDKVRNAKAAKPAGTLTTPSDPALIQAALEGSSQRPRLVFAIDATASREHAWEAARATTNALFEAVPGELDVALAVHGGSRVHLFTEFVSDPGPLRDRAHGVRCKAGSTLLVPLLQRCGELPRVKVMLYVGDVFEEDLAAAERAAVTLRLRGTRVIVLHDQEGGGGGPSGDAFARIAALTGGAVLPFDPSAIEALRALLEAVGALAVGGPKLLAERGRALQAGPTLLKLLSSTTTRD